MADVKKEKVDQPGEASPKKKSNALLYIVIGVIVLLIALGAAAFFVVKGLLNKGVDTLKEGQEWVEDVTEDYEFSDEDDSFTYKKTTEEKVDGDLEKKDLVTEKFPEDIPLPGGIVTASSYDDYSIEVQIDVNSSVEEIMEWYVQELEEKNWEITSRSSDEPMEGWMTGSIEFTKEERRGTINLDTNPFLKVTNITVKELLY